jgi:hypothetical protein
MIRKGPDPGQPRSVLHLISFPYPGNLLRCRPAAGTPIVCALAGLFDRRSRSGVEWLVEQADHFHSPARLKVLKSL